jgi:integrase
MLRVAPKLHLERERQAVYAPQLEQKVPTHAKQPLRDIAVIVFDAGMRPDEIVRLEWPQILRDKT